MKKFEINIDNRRASYHFELVNKFSAGIMLTGTEVKSVRDGRANLNDAYCFFHRGELMIKNMHISEYKYGNVNNHEPLRIRKLLLNKRELKRLEANVKEKGLTIVPTRLYTNERGLIKLEIALAKGKKTFSKRSSIKDKDVKRDMEREMKDR